MGYWNQTESGASLVNYPTGLIWGDQPADAMDEALEKIIDYFRRDWERLPTEAEVKAGLLFSLSVALERAQK
ncbi:hypothetical protein LCGC14_1724810 [marine sediment metagenome]|uniref:Uncharacterized protein n=1 Tax=marine sediment metagenome TaxID=412755 RepID=A0A0F9JRZ0_9ZZZZ